MRTVVHRPPFAPAPVSERVAHLFGAYVGGPEAVRLNLGCARNPERGFVNLDLDPRVAPDVVHDLEATPLPFPDATFDCVLGSHVFEHVRHFLPLVADLYRVLKPGGTLIAVTPYGSSDDAWDCPHHVRSFSENTWHYVGQALYDRTTLAHAGYGAYQGATYAPWRVETVLLVPYPELAADPDLAWKKRFLRNVIQEVHAVLRKPEAPDGA